MSDLSRVHIEGPCQECARLSARVEELEATVAALAKDADQLEDDREYNAGLVEELTAERDRLRGAAQDFVDKCDRGEAFSRRSYAKFKDALRPRAALAARGEAEK